MTQTIIDKAITVIPLSDGRRIYMVSGGARVGNTLMQLEAAQQVILASPFIEKVDVDDNLVYVTTNTPTRWAMPDEIVLTRLIEYLKWENLDVAVNHQQPGREGAAPTVELREIGVVITKNGKPRYTVKARAA